MVSTVPCDLVIYLYVTGFMVCLLDWRLCCLKVNVYWTLTDKKNHKSQNDQIQFWKSENHKIENKSIDEKLIIFKLVNRKLIVSIYTK